MLSQINNVSSDNKYREEFRRSLPVAYALPGDPWSFCAEVRTTGATVRGIAVDSPETNFIVGGVTARVYLGREDPTNMMNPFFEPTIYVQINPNYNPIDDPFTTTPQDNIPVIGIDIASTGAQWATGSYFELCMVVDIDSNLTVTRNGVTLYTGTAFANAASVVSFESENQAFGSGATQRVNDIELNCSALPVVTLPAFTLTYNDNFEWGIPGIPPLRHIDDPTNSPTTSTRYTNANGVAMADVNLTRGVSTLVAMANVFRDTAQVAPPDPNSTTAFIFSQFRTNVPNVTVGGSTRWVVEADFAFNDFTTSRGWSPAILSPPAPDTSSAATPGTRLRMTASTSSARRRRCPWRRPRHHPGPDPLLARHHGQPGLPRKWEYNSRPARLSGASMAPPSAPPTRSS